MAEFRPPNYGPMDREYHERIEFESQPATDIETPIMPISEIGATVPETDQSGRFKTFLQHAQATIRGGAGNLQLVMTVPHTSPIGGRFKAYGKEVRKALREIASANQVNISGVELPTSSMTNMSGYDMQRNRFSDEVRKDHLDEVEDAIKFVAESMGGGGVDIVSWEYDRSINDAPWNKNKEVQQPGEIETVQVVDTKTGSIAQIRKGEIQHLPYYVPESPEDITFDDDGQIIFKKITETDKGIPVLNTWDWKDFVKATEMINRAAEKHNKNLPENSKPAQTGIKPETLLIQKQLEAQLKTAKGYAGHYGTQAETHFKIFNITNEFSKTFDPSLTHEQRETALQQKFTEARIPIERETIKELARNKERLEKFAKNQEVEYEHLNSLATGQAQQVKEIEERQRRFTAVSDYAEAKTFQTYAEAGIAAMRETHNKNTFATHPVHVGPEIGWPQYYGSHPEEFVDVILKSREKMIELMTTPKQKNWKGNFVDKEGNDADKKGNLITAENAADNPYFKHGMSREEAEQQARTHIKGVFDTGHLGMWLRNFRPDLPWDERQEEFKKWFTKKVEDIAEVNKKHDILGGIQVVDSASGAHAHLPPGQGILPVFEATKILKEKGNFKGFIVSEGHEEEKFGEGRMLLKTWQKFGAHIENPYTPRGPSPMTWSRVQHSYFGKTYSPMFMFGSYAPSNEFKLWSEVPLE
ncbi:hypothetical protein HY484_00025 [Candidatus Woesearchaeota archaeon]|nr:hypothetical protein [Candidatus Woesearchaeota archaeon]